MTSLFRSLCFGLMIACSFSLTSCDWIYSLIQKEGAEEKEILGEIMPFDYNPRVEEVQQLLGLFGYSVGKADGKFGNVTRDAVARFQEDQGLPVTRFVDEATWNHMQAWKQSIFFKDGVVNIAIVQEALKAAGHDPGPIDGKHGQRTDAAIQSFQKASGLTVDGVIGINTIQALESYLQNKE